MEKTLSNEKLQAIAALLGGTVGGNEDITLADGVVFYLRAGGYGNEGRIVARGNYPSYTKPDGKYDFRTMVTPGDFYENGARLTAPSITVADTKTAEQIAKDIERRLLPSLRPVWLKCKARCVEAERYRDRQREVVERAAKATGGKANIGRDFARIEYSYDTGTAEYRGGYGDESAYFKVTLEHVTEAQLAQLLKVLK